MSHKGSCQILPSGNSALQDVTFPFFSVEHSLVMPFFFLTGFSHVMTSLNSERITHRDPR